MEIAQYDHRQTSSMPVLLAAAAVGFMLAIVVSVAPLGQPAVLLIFAVALLALALFAALLCCLTIRIVDRELRWSFGVFGWPRWSVPLDDIAAAEPTRTRLLDGWGVHRTKRGWLYNLAGFDAVLIERANGTTFLLGTDEPQQLAVAIDLARPRRRSKLRTRERAN